MMEELLSGIGLSLFTFKVPLYMRNDDSLRISNGEHNIKLTDNLCQMGQNSNINVNLNNTYLDIDLDDHILEISSAGIPIFTVSYAINIGNISHQSDSSNLLKNC